MGMRTHSGLQAEPQVACPGCERHVSAGRPQRALVVKARGAALWREGRSGVLLLITDQLALVRAAVPLAQEVLADGLQLRQLQPHFFQVVGTPVPDLPQREWVQVPEGDGNQPPAGAQGRAQRGGTLDTR